ncbi:MAG: hypothetical protein V1860_03850 [bacterium]
MNNKKRLQVKIIFMKKWIKILLISFSIIIAFFCLAVILFLNKNGKCAWRNEKRDCAQFKTEKECGEILGYFCRWDKNNCLNSVCEDFSNDKIACKEHYKDMGCDLRQSDMLQKDGSIVPKNYCVETSCYNFKSESECVNAPPGMFCLWANGKCAQDGLTSWHFEKYLDEAYCDYSIFTCPMHKKCKLKIKGLFMPSV